MFYKEKYTLCVFILTVIHVFVFEGTGARGHERLMPCKYHNKVVTVLK